MLSAKEKTKYMPATQEQKKKMRISRKKRKKLERKKAREDKQRARYSLHTQAALGAIQEEANRQKGLASKYYSKWRKCAQEKKEVAKLWDKKRETIEIHKSESTSNYVFSNVQPCELEDLQLESSIIGAGTFGECHLKKYTRFQICVVEKKLIDSDLSALNREAYFMQLFSHRCVPHLIGIQTSNKPYSLIMEFLGHGTESMTVQRLLFDVAFNEQRSAMCVANWFRVSYDIADALHYIHEKGYLHCDLKSNNVLVCNKKGYLIDFGKVCKVTNPRAKKYKITYPHIAPEVLSGKPVSKASDVFSLGRVIKLIGEEIKCQDLLSLGEKAAASLPKFRPSLLGVLTTLQPSMAKN